MKQVCSISCDTLFIRKYSCKVGLKYGAYGRNFPNGLFYFPSGSTGVLLLAELTVPLSGIIFW